MEYMLYRLNRQILRSTSLQIILISIFIHSLVSILMIYMHLNWYFTTQDSKFDEYSFGKKAGVNILSKSEAVNLISTGVIRTDSITVRGWWMDHSKWQTEIQCFANKWALCSKLFSTECKTDRIRAIYQYIPFRHDVSVTKIEINMRASADDLVEQMNDPFYGLLILIKLSDASNDTIHVAYPSEIDKWTSRTAHYSAPPGLHISQLTVMLLCLGYSGRVSFSDISIVPFTDTPTNTVPEVISFCGNNVEKLSFRDNNIALSTEYLELPKAIEKRHHDVTLVTQISIDRLAILEKSLKTWNGLVSIVIYVDVKDSKTTPRAIPDWQRKYITKKLKLLNVTSENTIILASGDDREYPINALRNLAIRHAKTKYLLLTDADFQPSPELVSRFMTSIKTTTFSKKSAFVVPAFEYLELPSNDDGIPKSKDEFLQLLHGNEPLVQPFRLMESAEAHRNTDYWKWYRSVSPYLISHFSDKYEPYIIVEKNSELPLFDERFTGYGMNKVTHTTELFAAGFKFYVLPNVWMIHLPHKTSSYSHEFLQNPHQRLKNRAQRFEFLYDVMKKYNLHKLQSDCS